MMGKVAVVLLVVVLLMSTVSCSGTLDLRVEKTPTTAVGPAADAVATLDAAVRATLAAPKATPTTSPDVQATVQSAVAATVAAQQGAAMPEPTAALPAPGGPSTLLFSTYLGGRDSDRIHDLAVDGEGNVYIVGTTSSPDLPTTPGAYDASHNGAKDAFVAKLSADGSTLLYSTYLGGGGDDSGNAIAVDGEGNAYVTGGTRSVDLPTTPGAADTRRDGGQDAFVAQLSADGGELIYGTYLGGDSDEAGLCIAVDGTRSAYVGGGTYSFPVTPGAAQTTHGGLIDGFVAKLSPDGDSLIYATYVGSSSYEQIAGIAVDREGNAYLATGASASDFPTTPGAYDRVCENCMTNVSGDAAVVKLSADGTRFIYSTLVGGADPKGQEAFHDVAVDSAGNAYLTGYSSSVDFPTTPGALQQTFGGGDFDVIVARLNADGSDLLYSTYLGGAGHEQGLGIAVDAAGSATVGGFTDSVDFPTAFPLQPANGGQKDFFLVKLEQDASTLLFGTYFGGGGDDFEDMSESFRMGFDQTGRGVYLTGATGSTDLPTTAGAYDVSFNGGAHDGFVALLNPFASEGPAAPAATPAAEASAPAFTRIITGDIVTDPAHTAFGCWGDYDNDGYLDLFQPNWEGQNNYLYHNNADGTFEKITDGGIVNDGGWSRACTWGDYDNDGYPDLFVSNDGGGNFLYHNEGGTSFTRILTGPIPQDDGNCYGSAWADYDNDGWLDLFVARHTNDDNLLYHNLGDGTFEKITTGDIVNDGGYSAVAAWGDYDDDGCSDLWVGNVGRENENDFLYHNNCDGTFEKITDGPIVNDGANSRGGNWVDYDNDLDLDLFVGNEGGDNVLYQNNGDGSFTSVTSTLIVTEGTIQDSSWADLDNDGDLDLYMGAEPARHRLYRNDGGGIFVPILDVPVVEDVNSVSSIWGDYDNDGDLDLYVSRGGGYTNLLYRNETTGNHWINIILVGTVSNRSAIGARITIEATINGAPVSQMREISGVTGGWNQDSLNVEFGLGDAPIVSAITIRWPSGIEQVLVDVPVDQILTVQEPG